MPVIGSIEGRKDDYIFSHERGWIGRMDPCLKGVEGILECQFVQRDSDSLDVLYVPAPEMRADDVAQLRRNLRQRLGTLIELRFTELEQIPRGANGKFRSVVSKLPKEFKASLHGERVAS
jgi:phenylacetate-CoA ligase